MLTQKQLKIFGTFAKHPFAELVRKQVKQKSNNALALAINKFKAEGIVRERKVGKSGLLSLNLESDLAYLYIALANSSRLGKDARRVIARIMEEIGKVTPFYSLVIFGSYAENRQTEKSDMDVAVFIDSEDKKRAMEAALNNAAVKSVIPLDPHVISREEFVEMLTNDEENLGKQIARKHLAVHNPHLFYALVREGIRHGFHL